MRLPLLAAARPRTAKYGPIVPLPSGKWHIVTEKLVDTILELLVNDVPFPTPIAAVMDGHIVVGPCNAQVMFVVRGSEEYINVSAELIRGS